MNQQLIVMTPKELSRYETIRRLIKKEINGTVAALQIGLSVRRVKRLKARIVKQGPAGLAHQSRGRPGNRKLDESKVKEIERIIRKKYSDFGPTFASEKLLENHGIEINKETTRQIMIGANLWQSRLKKKQRQFRKWRQRKERYGEMEQFDGCYHKWFENRGDNCCALASIDDATGKLTSLEFTSWEGVKNCMSFWKNYVSEKGKPLSIYLDRHSTCKQNQRSVFDDEKQLTQFQRVMQEELGIKIIHARSPQAKGRVERLFDTLQDRLVKEFRLAGISTIEEANKFVKRTFMPKFNSKFSVAPAKKGDLHKPLTAHEKQNLDKIFSIKNYRVVNNDFTIKFNGIWHQLEKDQPTLVRQKETVCIEERLSGQMLITLRDKILSYRALPERPKRTKTSVIALSRNNTAWRPPANHPWRKNLILNTAKN